MPSRPRLVLPVLVLALGSAGCGAATAPLAAPDGGGATVTVHRTESCSCCGEYEDHLRAHGFEVVIEVHDDATVLQDQLGVPPSLRSCHVNEVDGYLAVGHVPTAALVDLLEQQPTITGVALAGMPLGSPGMPGEAEGPFVVASFDVGSETGVFGTYTD